MEFVVDQQCPYDDKGKRYGVNIFIKPGQNKKYRYPGKLEGVKQKTKAFLCMLCLCGFFCFEQEKAGGNNGQHIVKNEQVEPRGLLCQHHATISADLKFNALVKNAKARVGDIQQPNHSGQPV